MRRAALIWLGLGEVLIAGVLIYVGFGLPSTAEVRAGFAQAERVTTQAGGQIHVLRQQVHVLRDLELRTLAERLQVQTHTLTRTLRTQPLDFAVVGTVRDAVGELATGMAGLAETLDPAAISRLGTGLDETATFLERLTASEVAAGVRGERGTEPATLAKDLAASLRQAAKGIGATVTRWPELRTTLTKLSRLLGTAREELNAALQNRRDYEEALRQTVQLADAVAAMLPLLTAQLAAQLDDQDRALYELGHGIAGFGALLPVYERSATRLVQAGRALAWIVAIFALVHVAYLGVGIVNREARAC